jgi:serine/threonine-protein kinase
MGDELDRLKTALADRYTIQRELGAGGMATVYLAEDLKHHRQVAIKVLRPELAASLGIERFVREIEIAANLTHPHILPLFDSGEADGFLYYVMPFIEGESLREQLDREGKLNVKEAIRLTDQVASALSHAHEHGLVHRDIKPENVLLAGDQAIVADFGIARAVAAAGGERLTGTGIAVGTPAYMSPEQSFGDSDIDGRSDVYALGCVVYEMVSGRAPFEAETPQALLAKHAVDTVPNLRTRDPNIPLFLERAVGRALAKTPAERFQTASAFAEALTSEVVVARVGERRWIRPALAVPVTIVVLAAAVWGYFTLLGGPKYERLAVLPPTNLMNDPEQEYFVAGMHNALISELQRAGVAVIARQSMLQYENTQKAIREIASELGVDALIEASVLRAADSVEIEARLVDGVTEQYVADPIVRRGEFRNVITLYRELTAAIAREINAALSPQAEVRLASAREVNPEAYEDYLKGQFHAGKFTPADMETALQYYQLALDREPDYPLAYAGIALDWAFQQQMGFVPPSEATPQARAALARALDLDSALVEVQYALAIVRTWTDWDWEAAETAYLRAIELNPNFPNVRAYYSHFLSMMKRSDEAIEQIERAMELDPYSDLLLGLCGLVYEGVGRHDDAIAQFELLLQREPDDAMAHWGLSQVYHAKGMHDEEVAAALSFYSAVGNTEAAEALALFYAEGDYREAMRRMGDMWAALSSATYVEPWNIAGHYVAAGEDSMALDWLERGFEERDPNLPYLAVETRYEPLHDEPRFQALLRRMGLPQ